MDVQFVPDGKHALTRYIMKYATKSEETTKQELWSQLSSAKSLRSRLLTFSRRFQQHREMGIYEAVGRTLQVCIYGAV